MNKIKTFLLILLCFLFLLNCKSSENKLEYDGEAIVATKSGLVLRENEGKKSPKILTIPHNSTVKIISQNSGGRGSRETIHGIQSNWYKVNYNEKIGWVFGGFLNGKNQKFKHLLPVLEKQGELEIFKRLGKDSPILFCHWDNPLAFNCHYDKDQKTFFCDCGRGFCEPKFISAKQTKKGAEIRVDFTDCTKIGDSEDGIGPCLETTTYGLEFVIDKALLSNVLNDRMISFYVKEKILWEKTKKE